ncbi:hypothetical protein D6810_01880 [Candidatus Dojkabacteria bacterium]|uniref:Uncharacterized protein n=1 Tax=Candidatus Dojkabacteria bacterium TaxID=2099670 RepID=A0A3M0Z0H9_9BACT|nr:MAG: hypothetical protein D6810_01880 [Candidatus Dojkabacteria bacterium]
MDKKLYDVLFMIQYIKYRGDTLLLPSSFYDLIVADFDTKRTLEKNIFSYIDLPKLLQKVTKVKITPDSFRDSKKLCNTAVDLLKTILKDHTNTLINQHLNYGELTSIGKILGLEDMSTLINSFIELISFAENLLIDQELFNYYLYLVNLSKFGLLKFSKTFFDTDKDTQMLEMIVPLGNYESYLIFSDKQFRDATISNVFKSGRIFAPQDINLVWEIYRAIKLNTELFDLTLAVIGGDKDQIEMISEKLKINIPKEHGEIKEISDLISFFESYVEYVKLDVENLSQKYPSSLAVSDGSSPILVFETVLNYFKLIGNNVVSSLLKFVNDDAFNDFLVDIRLLVDLTEILNFFDYTRLSKEHFQSVESLVNFVDERISVYSSTCCGFYDIQLLDVGYEKALEFILNKLVAKNEVLEKILPDVILDVKYPNILESPFANRKLITVLLNLAADVQEKTGESIFEGLFNESCSFKDVLDILKAAFSVREDLKKYADLF